jgi:hypothetical protein
MIHKKAYICFCILFFSLFCTVQSQQVLPLEIDKNKSQVWNKTTGETWKYSEFIALSKEERTFPEGHKFHFEFVIKNSYDSSSIPPDYRIDLTTNLSDPTWTYLGDEIEDPKATIWDTTEEHNSTEFTIELDAKIPQPVSEVTEPHFEDIKKLQGLVRRELFIRIDVRDTDETIQELTNDMKLYSTRKDLEQYMEQVKKLTLVRTEKKFNEEFENSENTIKELSTLRETIVLLAEQGHPGWAYDLSQNLMSFDESMGHLKHESNGCPWLFLVIIGLMIGAVSGVFLGAKFMRSTQPSLPNLEEQIAKIESVRGRIQEIREKDDKRKIELIGPESELKDISRRMKTIQTEINNIK